MSGDRQFNRQRKGTTTDEKHVAAVRLVDRDEATEAVELPEELRLPLGAIAGVAREGLLAMCTTVGLALMGEMMTAQMTAKVGGPKPQARAAAGKLA